MFEKEETNKMKTPVMPDSSPESREHAAEDEQSVRGRGSPMEHQGVSRRNCVEGWWCGVGGADGAAGGRPGARLPRPRRTRARWDDDQPDSVPSLGHPGDEVIPWLDQPAPNPVPPDVVGNQLKWEELDSWLTPPDKFHFVTHYGIPDGLDEATWRVGIAGLVARPLSLTLADLKARARREVDFTLGVLGQPWPTDFCHRRHRQCPLGRHAPGPGVGGSGCPEGGHRSVFYGADRGTVTIRDNSGIVSGGQTGTEEPDAGGGIDLTITEQFARSMSLDDALNPATCSATK